MYTLVHYCLLGYASEEGLGLGSDGCDFILLRLLKIGGILGGLSYKSFESALVRPLGFI